MISFSYIYTQSKYPPLLHVKVFAGYQNILPMAILSMRSLSKKTETTSIIPIQEMSYSEVTTQVRKELRISMGNSKNSQIRNRRKLPLGQREDVLLQPRGHFYLWMLHQWEYLVGVKVAKERQLLPEITL